MEIIINFIVSFKVIIACTMCFLLSAFVDWSKIPWWATMTSAIGVSILIDMLVKFGIALLVVSASGA